FPNSERTSCIKLCNVTTKKTYPVTKSVLQDFSPSFDPDGKYLYFLSNRHFDPVYDTMQFELSFPANIKPYLITLKADIPSPFKYTQIAPSGLETPNFEKEMLKPKKPPKKIKIDIKGIETRIIPFPLASAKYDQIYGMKDKVLFSTFPITGGIALWLSDEHRSNGTLEFYDLKEQKSDVITTGISSFKVSQDSENSYLLFKESIENC
ncbi:unnamed protein product, partial [marine sediment metagenome]